MYWRIITSYFIFSSRISTTNGGGNLSRYNDFLSEANKIEDWVIDIRRSLHMIPEVGLNNVKTSEFIRNIISNDLNLSYYSITKNDSISDIVIDINSTGGLTSDLDINSTVSILLRSDTDGLPIEESMNGLEYRSKMNGTSHLCGHDGHMSILLGATKLLISNKNKWFGHIRLLFQPGEEGFFGGKHVVQSGIIDKTPQIQSAFGIHVMPSIPTGSILLFPNIVTVSGRQFVINVYGQGGHAGIPGLTRDPIVASAALILNLQNLSSRETLGLGSSKAGLISITSLKHVGPDTFNAIPTQVQIKGTLRCPDHDTLLFMSNRIVQITSSLKSSHRIDSTVDFLPIMPGVVNSPTLVNHHRPLVKHAAIANHTLNVNDIYYIMEDFSFISSQVPSLFVLLGSGGTYKQRGTHTETETGTKHSGTGAVANKPQLVLPTNASLHSPNFVLDETVLVRGAALLASLAADELDRLRLSHSGLGSSKKFDEL